ncbi:MAG: ATP-binding protein [Planctomycetota bacterium]|nr:ATP-binding protein [Planctomycetota bacterium]
MLWSFRRLTDDPQEGALYLLLIHDLTAYKALEAEVRRQEGLAQLGRMIAAINHELNNLMQPVRYQVSKLVDLEIDHPVFQRAQALIPERLAAMERMLQGLRDYARPLELRARPLEPRPLLESVLRDFEAEAARDGVALSLAAVPNLPEVQGDGTWLRQVFHNLVRNAIEASWGRPGPEVRLRADAQDGELIVEVSDNGAGVAPELRERIFEPFFSTKEDAGTGLGLPLCRKIVERHGGRIELESAPGAGARFIVRLPAAARRDAAATAAT